MYKRKIIISGTGCALGDFIFHNVSFESPAFKKFASLKDGDGGLNPGKLVFTDELEKFAGIPYSRILKELVGERSHDAFNIGGPSLVSLIHASQLLDNNYFSVNFYGIAGRDEITEGIMKILSQTPLLTGNYGTSDRGSTPFTHVLSDPEYNNRHGERTFINHTGVANHYRPEMLGKDFFRSDIVCFGGTALVPLIHHDLSNLLSMARKNHCISLVNTVFDFFSEKASPARPWRLTSHPDDLKLIDLLIMDAVEAVRISGEPDIERACSFFIRQKVPAFIITNGPDKLIACSNGSLFKKTGPRFFPVSGKIRQGLKSGLYPQGDTTGCGDNFTGGVLAYLAEQLSAGSVPSLDEAVAWGVVSGGFCCTHAGGTYIEKTAGKKKTMIESLLNEYLKQIKDEIRE